MCIRDRYTATIEIQVAAVGKDIIPLTSYKVYDALEADANNDGMISTEEIKNVKSINLENKDLTNADLAGLSEAVNCEKIDLENNKNITDISFIKNLKQLKTLYLRGTSVTDFTALNDLKAQLESLYPVSYTHLIKLRIFKRKGVYVRRYWFSIYVVADRCLLYSETSQ